MKFTSVFAIPLFTVAASALLSSLSAQMLSDYQLSTTIPIASNLQSFDISWIDQGSQRFYLADRGNGNGQGRIDVIDTSRSTFLYSIPTSPAETGFAGILTAVTPGCTISGPNGVVAIPLLNQLYVGDGDSTVKVVDLAAKAVVATIPTGGNCRADELAYDPLDHIIMITNPSDNPPFVTFISTDTQSVLGRYTYPSTQVGLEQAVWNPQTYRFLISVPAIAPSTQGSVDEFDPLTMKMTNSYKIGCSPAGLALGPLQRTMTSCGNVLDARSGSILGAVTLPAGDEIWFNPGDNRYYFGNAQIGVIDAETNQLLGFLPGAGGHTLAVDSNNNNIFVPVTGVGVNVFTPIRK
jgi:DNA-binding beta-propeller fold protein YncE